MASLYPRIDPLFNRNGIRHVEEATAVILHITGENMRLHGKGGCGPESATPEKNGGVDGI
jgi:hypothetical protein